MATQIHIPSSVSTILLGSGFDSLAGEDRDRIMANSEVGHLAGLSGQTIVNIREIRNRQEFNNLLGLHGSAKFNIGKFGGSSDVDAIHNYEFSSQAYYLAISVTVQKESEVLNEFTIREEAKALLSNPSAFFNVGGDHFVASRVAGGELIAILRLETTTTKELLKLKAEFKGKYASVFQGSGSVSNEISESFEKYNGSYFYIRRGGLGGVPTNLSPDSVKEAVASFPSEILNNQNSPVVFAVGVKPYRDLIDFVNVELYNLINAREVLSSLVGWYDNALDAHNEISYILQHLDQFKNPELPHLYSLDMELTRVLNLIRVHARNCYGNPTDPKICRFLSIEEINYPQFKLPERISGVYKLLRSHVCGIEKYEKKKILKSCKTKANGEEIVERRIFQEKCGSSDDSEDRLKEWIEAGKNNPFLFWHNGVSPSTFGYDENWRIGRITYKQGYIGSEETDDNRFWYTAEVDLEVELQRIEFKYAPHEDCGFEMVDDETKPIFKECRHESHGLE